MLNELAQHRAGQIFVAAQLLKLQVGLFELARERLQLLHENWKGCVISAKLTIPQSYTFLSGTTRATV